MTKKFIGPTKRPNKKLLEQEIISVIEIITKINQDITLTKQRYEQRPIKKLKDFFHERKKNLRYWERELNELKSKHNKYYDDK